MKKAIIIVTTNDRKNDRFIKFDENRENDVNYHQEWEDGWKFEKGKKYALRKNSEKVQFLDDINALNSLITTNKKDTLVIWVNQYLVENDELKKDVNKLYKDLSTQNFNVKIALHNAPEVFDKYKNYSLAKDELHKFTKIINRNSSNENMLNPRANFDDIEEVFFQPLDTQKKTLINLWLPLAIDIQGLSEVQSDEKKANEYFKEIKQETDYLNSLNSFPNEDEFPRWEEIKYELNKGYKNFNPTILIKEITTQEDFSTFDKKYFTDPNFLPNWLQKVVSVLDDKINRGKQ